MLVTSVVGVAALPPAAPPPVVANTPPEGDPATGLELCCPPAGEAVALALAAGAVPAAAPPPVSPAVAVGRGPAPVVCPFATQSEPETEDKLGLAPSVSTFCPGSGYMGSVLGVDLHELMSARLPTKSST